MEKMLLEVDRQKGLIITMDGTKYQVSPGYIPTCCTWIPTARLLVEEKNGTQIITNLECDISVELL